MNLRPNIDISSDGVKLSIVCTRKNVTKSMKPEENAKVCNSMERGYLQFGSGTR